VSLVKVHSNTNALAAPEHTKASATKAIKLHKSRSISVKRIKPLIKLLVADGISIHELLRNTHFDYRDLLRQNSRIQLSQYQLLIRNALDLSADHSFGARLGEQFHFNHDALLSYRIMASQNVSEAMKLLSTYQPLLTDMLELEYRETPDEGILRLIPAQQLGPSLPFFIEYIFAIVFATGRFFLNAKELPIEIHLSYCAPKDYRYFKRYFPSGSVLFNQTENQAIIPRSILEHKLVFSDHSLAHKIDLDCQHRVHTINEADGLLKQVRNIIRRTGPNNVSLEHIADEFCLSPRSLRRKLATEGVSYKSLLEEERKSLALDSVQNTSLTLEHIAEQLGYKDCSSFSRAFKRWFGSSPQHFRRAHYG